MYVYVRVHAQYVYRIEVILIFIQVARESGVRCYMTNICAIITIIVATLVIRTREHMIQSRVLQLRNKNSNKWGAPHRKNLF